MALEELIDQFNCDMTITRAKYERFIASEDRLNSLRYVMRKKIIRDEGLTRSELELVYHTVFREDKNGIYTTEEETSNTEG